MMDGMVGVNIFAFIVAFLIYLNVRKNRYPFFSLRLFLHLIRLIMVMIVVSILSVAFDGMTGPFYEVMNWIANFFLFILSTLPSIIWLMYVHFSIFQLHRHVRTIAYYGFGLFLVNAFLTFVTYRTHWYFYIDDFNVYHRGELIWLHAVMTYGLLLVTIILIILNRQHFIRKQYLALLLFPLPILAGSLLQISINDLWVAIPSGVISILAVYLNIHEKDVNLDFLTGAFNRRSFEIFLEQRIRSSRRKSGFSLIFLDLDHFKSINDQLGHRVGDEVLQKTVSLLQDCLQNRGLLARIGGDEFGIILNHDDRERLEQLVQQIETMLDQYNQNSGKPYLIEVSMGYDVYAKGSQMSRADFLRHVDTLMYESKRQHSMVEAFLQVNPEPAEDNIAKFASNHKEIAK